METSTHFPTVRFANDIVAQIMQIQIRFTYADFLEVRPCPQFNAEVMKKLRQSMGNGRGPVLVVPVDKSLIDVTSGDPFELRPLPKFEMLAELQSDTTTDSSQDYSFLTMAWHQDTLFPLIDDETGRRVSKIPWFPRASHGSY